MAREVVLDGSTIQSMEDFHKLMATELKFPAYYGNNLDALWDMLSNLKDPNITIIWKNHRKSRDGLGHQFMTIISIFEDTRNEHADFSYQLE